MPLRLGALSTAPDRFVGRAREVEEIHALLRDPDVRLFTLTGPGGIGKTRLALRVPEELRERYADGICFVALGDLADSALVMPAIAAALGLHESAHETPTFQLAEALRVTL